MFNPIFFFILVILVGLFFISYFKQQLQTCLFTLRFGKVFCFVTASWRLMRIPFSEDEKHLGFNYDLNYVLSIFLLLILGCGLTILIRVCLKEIELEAETKTNYNKAISPIDLEKMDENKPTKLIKLSNEIERSDKDS